MVHVKERARTQPVIVTVYQRNKKHRLLLFSYLFHRFVRYIPLKKLHGKNNKQTDRRKKPEIRKVENDFPKLPKVRYSARNDVTRDEIVMEKDTRGNDRELHLLKTIENLNWNDRPAGTKRTTWDRRSTVIVGARGQTDFSLLVLFPS